MSVIYFLCLLFAIYQNYKDVAETMYWLYPELRDSKPDDKVGETTGILIGSSYCMYPELCDSKPDDKVS